MRIFRKIILGLIILLLLGLIGVFIYFSNNKDEIARDILSYSSSHTKGELNFKNISLSPLSLFPYMSISLNDVQYFESDSTQRDSLETAIISMEKIYLRFNLPQILRGNLSITGAVFENGIVHIIRHKDSTINIVNAFKDIETSGDTKIPEEKELIEESSGEALNISLDKLKLDNIQLVYRDKVSRTKLKMNIDELYSKVLIKEDTLAFKLNTSLFLSELPDLNFISFDKAELKIDSDLNISMADSTAFLNNTTLLLNNAQLMLDGKYNFSMEPGLELQLSVNDNDKSLANLFLSKRAIENIKGGSIILNGKINHSFTDELPEITCSLDIRNLNVNIPGSDNEINDLNLKAGFSSGKKDDLSNAVISIDTLYNNSGVRAKIKIKNLIKPEIKSRINADIDLSDYDKLFRAGIFEEIKGKIGLNIDYHGFLKYDSLHLPVRDDLKINFDNFSCNIPETIELNLLNGEISGNSNYLLFDDLKIVAGKTDLFMNGYVKDLLGLFSDNKDCATTNLSLQSEVFDLAEIVECTPGFYPGEFRERFDYLILNSELETHGTIKVDDNNDTYVYSFDIPSCFLRQRISLSILNTQNYMVV